MHFACLNVFRVLCHIKPLKGHEKDLFHKLKKTRAGRSGVAMLKTRKECDALGSVCVPEECYWGPQTQRSIENFKIGKEKMPPALIRGFGLQKQGGAEVNIGSVCWILWWARPSFRRLEKSPRENGQSTSPCLYGKQDQEPKPI